MSLTLVGPDAAAVGAGSRGPVEIRESVTMFVDAPLAAVREALARTDVTGPALRTLDSLGVAERAALAPTVMDANVDGVRSGLIWRLEPDASTGAVPVSAFESFAAAGHVKLSSEVSVRLAGDGRTVASVTTRVAATDTVLAGRAHPSTRRPLIGPRSAAARRETPRRRTVRWVSGRRFRCL
jgi:hypothetical protein